MKQVSDLKQGDKIYYLLGEEVAWCTYLCVHPLITWENFYIVIDPCFDPIKISHKRLQELLDQNIKDEEEANLKLAEKLEGEARELRKKYVLL